MNCAYGIMMTETKIPKDIINMIMDFIITPNKKGLITDFNLLNVSNHTPKEFMRMIRFNNYKKYNDILISKINRILYYPMLSEDNTKYMSFNNQLQLVNNIKGLEKHRILNIIKNYNKGKNNIYFNKPIFETERIKGLEYSDTTETLYLKQNNTDDFEKRLNNIDATYKVFGDSVLNTDKTEIMKNNYLRNYNIDVFTQKQFSKVRIEITSYYNVKEYMKIIKDTFKYGFDGKFNLNETYKFCSINSRRDAMIYKATDCFEQFDEFEIKNITNKYFTFETYYNLNGDKIKITEKVQKSNLRYCLNSLNNIIEYQHQNLAHFHNQLCEIDFFKLDMNKINKKYNLNIDMKHYKKVYGSKYAYITTDKDIEPLSMIFIAEKWVKMNPEAFNKFKKQYFK